MICRRLLAMLGILFLSAPILASPLTKKQVVGDLKYFRDVWAPKDHSYSATTRARMLSFINGQIQHSRPMQRYELALIFAQAEALSNNAHTEWNYFAVDKSLFHTLPISFWEFPEGPIVTRAHPQFHRLLGARILSIGGLPYAQAAKRVAKFIAGTAERKRYLRPAWLSRIEILEAVGLAKNGIADVKFKLSSGKDSIEHLGASPTPDPAAFSPQWHAALVPGKGPEPWPSVLDHLSKLPLALQPPDEFHATSLQNGNTLYIRSTSLSPYQGEITVMLKAYVIMDQMVKSPKLPKNIIVDLRYNEGGNFLNIVMFSKELAQAIGPNGHIYVIEGRATFSAAISFAALLKVDASGRTTLVGEEPSDHPWFWSEGGILHAPASKLPLRYTNGYHDWAHGCTDLAKCYWPVVFHGVAAGSLRPTMAVDMTYADYYAGKDPALAAIMADINRRAGKTD